MGAWLGGQALLHTRSRVRWGGRCLNWGSCDDGLCYMYSGSRSSKECESPGQHVHGLEHVGVSKSIEISVAASEIYNGKAENKVQILIFRDWQEMWVCLK